LRRITLNLVAFLSLLLCLAACAFWPFNDRFVLMITAGGERWAISAASCDSGLLAVFRRNDGPDYPWGPGVNTLFYDLSSYNGPPRTVDQLSVLYRPRVSETFLGFGYQPDHELGYRRSWIARAPYAAIIALLALPPIGWALRRKKRKIGNNCPKCGYDLRATPDRCPECGLAVGSQTGQ
jgi:hypothetical protein